MRLYYSVIDPDASIYKELFPSEMEIKNKKKIVLHTTGI
jgi:hypothetical protein